MAANEAIFSRAQRNQRLSGMGTTLVVMATQEQHVWILNIGDSRCYLWRQGRLEQLTRDHSLVEEQVRLGRMTAREALHSPLKNVITRALGTQSQVTPDIFQIEAEPGDVFLLCSDGLWEMVHDEDLARILAETPNPQAACDALVRAANEHGGEDNISALIVEIGG